MIKEHIVDWDTITNFVIDAFVGYGIPRADAEICAAVKVCNSTNENTVNEASFGEPNNASRSEYTVVYVPEGESLWSIAKKYSVAPSAVAEANGLRAASPAAPDSLDGVDFLII